MVTLDEIAQAIKTEVDANNFVALKRFFDFLNELNDRVNQKLQADAQKIHDDNMTLANGWWNTIKPIIPTTRDEALTVYRFIKNQLEIETDQYRKELLRQKLQQAEEKFMELKRQIA